MPLKPLPQDIIWNDQLPQTQNPSVTANPNIIWNDQKLPTPQEEALQSPIPQFIKQAALPVAGSIAGGIGATAAGLPPTIGQSIGGGAGEGLNQLLGITEPSMKQIGINALTPLALSLIAAGGKGVISSIASRSNPGRIVGQAQAVAEARGIPDIIKTASSEPIYQELHQINPTIPISNVSSTISKLSSQEQMALEGQKIAPLSRILKGFISKIKGTPDTIIESPILNPQGKPNINIVPGEPGGNMSFQELWTSIKRIGSRIDETQGTERGALKKIYGSLWDDLNKASETLPSDIGSQLKIANQAYRREMATSDLAQQIEKAISPQAGTGNEYINVKGILNWMNKSSDSEFFQKSLSSSELGQVKNVLYRLIKTPSLPPPELTPIGSGKVLAKVLAQGGIGGVAATAVTGSPTIGGIVGSLTPFAISKGSQLISQALLTQPGRQFLLKLMATGGPILSHTNFGLLGEFLASETATARKAGQTSEPNFSGAPMIQNLPDIKISKLPDSIGAQ